MKKLISVIVLSALGLGVAPVYSDEGSKAKINNYDEHNKNMNQCIKTALEKHPGGVIEVEFEKEDDKFIFEVEVQGKDGKKWELSCDAATGDVIKDVEDKEEDKKDKKEDGKEKKW